MEFTGNALLYQWKVFSKKKKISVDLETSCKMMQNKLDAFFQKGPPQEPLRENPANRLQKEKEHILGSVVVWTGLIQPRLFLLIHLLALHLHF